DASEIPAQVVAVRAVGSIERVERVDREPVELDGFRVREPTEGAFVPERRAEEMAGGVGELVQDDERRLAAHDHEGRGLRNLSECLATEDAAVLLVRLLDVLESPRRPQRLGHARVLPPVGQRCTGTKSSPVRGTFGPGTGPSAD